MLRRIALIAAAACLGSWAFGQAKAEPKAQLQPHTQGAPDENVVKILRTSNKAQTNKFVCETLEFKNVNPFNVVNYFWAVTSREEGGIYSFAHPTEQRGFIVVICPEYQLETLRKLAAELDRPKLNSFPGSAYIYKRLNHRSIADACFLNMLALYRGTSGVLWPDVETNSLLIYDAPAAAEAVVKALDTQLDQPLQQVEVAVAVYEVDVNSDGTIGLDFEAWKNGPGKLLYQLRASGQHLDFEGHQGAEGSHTNGHGFYVDYPSAFFDFMVEKGKARSVINTKIIASNRVPALLTTGERILYYQQTETPTNREVNGVTAEEVLAALALSGNGRVLSATNARQPFTNPNYALTQYPVSGRPVASQVRAADAGVLFAVVPTVGEKTINLDLTLRVIDSLGYDSTGKPLLGSREIADSISVANGEEVMFGGLVREQKIQSSRKVPILGSLPVIGWVFGGEIDSNKKSRIFTAIRPVLIKDHSNQADADDAIAAKARDEKVVELP